MAGWPFGKHTRGARAPLPLYLHNTASGAKEVFTLPYPARTVRMYNCGPTVYGPQHIGNLSMFVFTDILRRTLQYNGFAVKQVINFTDFGHLVSDADEGEDKMMRGLKREGLAPTMENMLALGRKYAEDFKRNIAALNIDEKAIEFPFASDYVPAQIAMIATLEEKGYAYRTPRGVYFDTAKFGRYGALGGINKETQPEGARVAADPEKRSARDFVLWKSDAASGWDSPWGKGFPGWHIECSAMINSILGKQIDIHTGGIEHIPIHHNNEIAQSEAATGKSPLARFWMHRAHLRIAGAKIAKSEGDVVYLSDITERGYHPLSFRYMLLGSQYRTPANFTWEALEAAQTSFLKLRRFVDTERGAGEAPEAWRRNVHERINDDLDTPGALAVLWESQRDVSLSKSEQRALVLDADKVLGLGFERDDPLATALCKKSFGELVELEQASERVRALVLAREEARKTRNWQHSDTLRADLKKMGYAVEDTSDGPRLFKKD